MGQKNCTPVDPIFPLYHPLMYHRHSTKHNDRFDGASLKSQKSISNPSLTTITEDRLKEVEITLSEQFNNKIMISLYESFGEDMGYKDENQFVSQDVLKAVTNIVENVSLDENILYLATRLREGLYQVDDNWNIKFGECSLRNPVKYNVANASISTKVLFHTMCVLRTIRFITSHLEEGNVQRAKEIIRLCSLSHLVMKVRYEFFQIFIVMVIKTLLHHKLLSEEGLPVFVYYMQTLLTHMQMCSTDIVCSHAKLYYGMGDGSDGAAAPAREYYRILKSWKEFIHLLTISLTKPFKGMIKQIEEEHERHLQQMVQDVVHKENWKIVDILKKGYKFRKIFVSDKIAF